MHEIDPTDAESSGFRLWSIPYAWCDRVLPSRTPEQFDAQLAAADDHGRQLATLLNWPYAETVPAERREFHRLAREEAGRMFCPARVANPGYSSLPSDLSIPERTLGTELLLPYWYASNSFSPARMDSYPRTQLQYAYVEMLAGYDRPNITFPDSSFGGYCTLLRVDQPLEEIAENIRESTVDLSQVEIAARINSVTQNYFIQAELRHDEDKLCGP